MTHGVTNRPKALRSAILRGLCLLVALGGSSCVMGYDLAEVSPPPITPFKSSRARLAQVCVFRTSTLGASSTLLIRDNEMLVGATQGRTYFCYYAEPGLHRITTEGSDADARIVLLRPGSRYHVRHDVNLGTDELAWISEPEARLLITKCDYVVIEGAPADESVPSLEPVAPAAPDSFHP